ncbi:MAG: ribosomal protein S18-alanine N-acetyltransferase [Ilumatobacteraceae bacterium]
MSVLSKLLGRDGHSGIAIEPLRRKHLTALMPIEQASYPKPWSVSVFHSELEMMRRGERTYLAAMEGRSLVGYAGMLYSMDDGHVTNIAVSADHQRRGIATRLLAELAWAAIERGCTGMTLEVRVSNRGAQALYERFGFESAGIRKNYYENVEDAIVMWRRGILEPAYRDDLRDLCPEAAR